MGFVTDRHLGEHVRRRARRAHAPRPCSRDRPSSEPVCAGAVTIDSPNERVGEPIAERSEGQAGHMAAGE